MLKNFIISVLENVLSIAQMVDFGDVCVLLMNCDFTDHFLIPFR